MLNITIKLSCKIKEGHDPIINTRLAETGFRSIFHETLNCWAERKYCHIFGVRDKLTIDCDLDVLKRKLTPQTKDLLKKCAQRILNQYSKHFENLYLEIEVNDDSDNRFYIEEEMR